MTPVNDGGWWRLRPASKPPNEFAFRHPSARWQASSQPLFPAAPHSFVADSEPHASHPAMYPTMGPQSTHIHTRTAAGPLSRSRCSRLDPLRRLVRQGLGPARARSSRCAHMRRPVMGTDGRRAHQDEVALFWPLARPSRAPAIGHSAPTVNPAAGHEPLRRDEGCCWLPHFSYRRQRHETHMHASWPSRAGPAPFGPSLWRIVPCFCRSACSWAHVCMWLCGCVSVWFCVAAWPRGHEALCSGARVAAWPRYCVGGWPCGCGRMAAWLCGFVVAGPHVAVWLRDCVGMWLCGRMAAWPHGRAVLWPPD